MATKIEIIRAEIEKRIDEATLLENKNDDSFYAGKVDGLECALEIINTFNETEKI